MTLILKRVRHYRKPSIGPGPSNLWMANRFLNGQFVRSADLHPPKMLHDARMAGLVKLRRSTGHLGERQQWAGRVGQNDAGQAGDAAARKAGQRPQRMSGPQAKFPGFTSKTPTRKSKDRAA